MSTGFQWWDTCWRYVLKQSTNYLYSFRWCPWSKYLWREQHLLRMHHSCWITIIHSRDHQLSAEGIPATPKKPLKRTSVGREGTFFFLVTVGKWAAEGQWAILGGIGFIRIALSKTSQYLNAYMYTNIKRPCNFLNLMSIYFKKSCFKDKSAEIQLFMIDCLNGHLGQSVRLLTPRVLLIVGGILVINSIKISNNVTFQVRLWWFSFMVQILMTFLLPMTLQATKCFVIILWIFNNLSYRNVYQCRSARCFKYIDQSIPSGLHP